MTDENSSRSLDREIYKTFTERSPDGVFALTAELEMVFVNETIESLTGKDRDDIVGNHAEVFLEIDVVDQEAYDRAIEACKTVLSENSVSSRSFQIRLQTPNGPIDTEYRVTRVENQSQTADLIGTIRDISDRVAQERRLARRRNELNTVSQIQTLIQRIIQSFSEAPTREVIRETVCDRLAASEYYRGVWIADVQHDKDGLSNLYTAGLGTDLKQSLSEHAIQGQELSFVSEALDTEQPQVVTDIETSPLLPAHVRQLGVKYDHQSVLTIPITINSSVISILTVATSREHAFGSRELSAFEVLADLIGFALTAVEGKQLLLGEGAVEYDLRFSTGTLSGTLTDTYEGELTLESVLPGTQQGCRCYFIANPALPTDILESTKTFPNVTRFEVVDTWERGARYEAVLTDSPLISLAEAGTNVVGGHAVDGDTYITIQATRSRDPAEFLNVIKETYPDVELVAERAPESADSIASLSQWLNKELTPKQREMLEGAYYQGYFKWPRERSAETVADSFDITSSTFHAHIRKALQKMLSAIFEGNLSVSHSHGSR